MKNVLLVFMLVIVFAGCMYKGRSYHTEYLPREVAGGSIEYNNRLYYIVKPTDFLNVREDFSPTYKGTVGNYHLFFTFVKIDYKEKISTFAVSKDDCIVENERSPEEETAIRRHTYSYRKALIEKGKCIVKKRENKPVSPVGQNPSAVLPYLSLATRSITNSP